MHTVCNEYSLQKTIVLIFANKQDLSNALSIKDISEMLNLDELEDRKWHLQESCATENKGLYEGFDWVVNNLKTTYSFNNS